MVGRGGRWGARALMLWGVVSVLMAGCTTSPPPPTAGGPSTAPTGGAPSSGMTAIAESAECTVHQAADDSRVGLPERVFRNVKGMVVDPPDETLLGPDGSDLARCPGELPQDIRCDQSAPWSGLDRNTFLTAGGATREVRQGLVALPGDTMGIMGPSSPGARGLELHQFYLAPRDPRGLVPYLQRAFEKCTHAKPTTIDGRAAMVGTAASEQGAAVPAQFVLLTTGTAAAWVVLEGSGWKSADRTHALQEVVRYLKSSG